MKKIVASLFLLFVLQSVHAQKIGMYKTFSGVIYLLNDTLEINSKQTASILFTHPKAYSEFKIARHWSVASAITGFTGSLLIAIPLVTLALNGNAEWGYAIGGGVLVAASFICNYQYKSFALYSIDLYNADLPQKTSRIKPQFQFYGTGLAIKF